MLPGKDNKLFNSLINISRWLLALVIMASGFLKAVDPKGAMLKLQEYADVLFFKNARVMLADGDGIE